MRTKVITGEGDIKASPQKFLDSLLSKFSFDPIQFIALNGKERAKYLRDAFQLKIKKEQLIPEGKIPDWLQEKLDVVDVSGDAVTICNALADTVYAVRSNINRDMRALTGYIAEKEKTLGDYDPNTFVGDKGDEIEAVIQNWATELADAEAALRQAKGTQPLVEKLKGKIAQAEESLAVYQGVNLEGNVTHLNEMQTDLEQTIAKAQAKLQEVINAKIKNEGSIAERDQLIKDLEEMKGTLEQLPSTESLPKLDKKVVEAQGFLREAEEANGYYKEALVKHEEWMKIGERKVELAGMDKESRFLTSLRDFFADLPSMLAREQDSPLQGLEFKGDDVYIGGNKMENLSTSEQVEIALNIVRHMNKDTELKLMCLDRAESLDDDTLADFEKQIQDDEFQYFLTIVQHEGQIVPEGAYAITDGAVSKGVADEQSTHSSEEGK
jgi:disulfide oxidoreductase YuzD